MTHAADLVADAPWFGGVHVCERGRLLLTIAGDNPEIPGPLPPRAHVRWIGGKPRPRESYEECALREAEEELGCRVELEHACETVVELRPAAPERLALDDRPAPLLVQRYDDGEVLVVYRARPLATPYPADVERLVWVPLEAVEPLCDGVAPVEAKRLGIEVLGPPLRSEAPLFIGRGGAEHLLWCLGVDAATP